jgi:hypothetical protein
MRWVISFLGLALVLTTLTMSGCNPSVEEVRSMTDQKELASLALNSSSSEVRLAAAATIQDQKILTQIIESSPYQEVRLAAANSVKDPDKLTRMILTDSDPKVRQTALNQLTDQNSLTMVATKAPHMDSRIAAMQRVKDAYVLANIAMNDSEFFARKNAREQLLARLGNLKDPKWLAVVARTSDGKLVPEYVQRLLKEIPGRREDCESIADSIVDALRATVKPAIRKKYGKLQLRCDCNWANSTHRSDGNGAIPIRQQNIRIQFSKENGSVVYVETFKGALPKNISPPKDGSPLLLPATVNPYRIGKRLLNPTPSKTN